MLVHFDDFHVRNMFIKKYCKGLCIFFHMSNLGATTYPASSVSNNTNDVPKKENIFDIFCFSRISRWFCDPCLPNVGLNNMSLIRSASEWWLNWVRVCDRVGQKSISKREKTHYFFKIFFFGHINCIVPCATQRTSARSKILMTKKNTQTFTSFSSRT